jgi:hypothetical protein
MKKTIITMAVMACIAMAFSTSYGQEPVKRNSAAEGPYEL